MEEFTGYVWDLKMKTDIRGLNASEFLDLGYSPDAGLSRRMCRIFRRKIENA